MIKITTTITALIILLLNCAPSSNQETLQQLQLIEDKMALKTLVDEFSNLADVKDVEAQLLLFTEDAVVQSSSNGNMSSVFNGREEIGDAFSGFLANFETVYHINGQQTVEINGTNATGIAYCLVVLISENEGIREKRTMGVRYNDEYVKENNKWFIQRRHSNFMWSETAPLN